MKKLLVDAGVVNEHITAACDKSYDACDVGASSGRPKTKIISIAHVNEVSNRGLQIDLMMLYLRDDKFEVRNIVATGTRCGERFIAPSKFSQTIFNLIEP